MDAREKPVGWRQSIVHELIEYCIDFGYLAFFFAAFVWYRRLILDEYRIVYTHYWFPLIQAAVLAKVIMLGDFLRLGRRLGQKPLIVTILFRTVIFILWVAMFRLFEATVRGLLNGSGLTAGFNEIANEGRYELLAGCVVIFVAFIPFFAFKELEQAVGAEKLRALFWRPAKSPTLPS